MSICAADQRYYTGSRDENVLSKKLPMSLIHEGVGEVVFN
jgi:ribitol-5-phosphate 2-dehydrogenase